MNAEVGFVHRSDRMDAHDRVPVDPINLAVGARTGEQIAEQAVAAQGGVAGDDRHHAGGQMLARNLDDVPDAADRR